MRKKRNYEFYMREVFFDVDQKKKMEEKKERKEEKGIVQDFNNRQYIRNRIKEYMIKGFSKEEAVDLTIRQEKEIVSQFDYLTRNGLDIRQCFINWSRDVEKQLEKKEKSNNGEER